MSKAQPQRALLVGEGPNNLERLPRSGKRLPLPSVFQPHVRHVA